MSQEKYPCFYCESKVLEENIYDSIEDTFYICDDCYIDHKTEWDKTKKEYEK